MSKYLVKYEAIQLVTRKLSFVMDVHSRSSGDVLFCNIFEIHVGHFTLKS